MIDVRRPLGRLWASALFLPLVGGCLLEFPLAPPSTGDDPRLFYSDLSSAPPGAYVTLFGARFSSSPGTVELRVGPEPSPLTVVSWSDSVIEARLPSGTRTGPATVAVRSASGLASNALEIGVHDGRVWFVKPAGDGDGSEENPFGSLLAARDLLAPGDVLYLRGGSYVGEDPAAPGAVLGLVEVPTGRPDAPVAIVGYPGESATIGDGSLPYGLSLFRGTDGPSLDYLTIARLHFRPSCSAVIVGRQVGAHDFGRFVDNEVTGASDPCQDGAFKGTGSRGWRVLGNHIHDNGNTKFEHGIFLAGFGALIDWEIAFNVIEEQRGGRGIQVFGTLAGDSVSDLDIHDNTVRGIDRDGILVGDSDAPPMTVRGVRLTNNVVVNAGRCIGRGVRLANPSADDVRVLFNTLVDNGTGERACDQSDGELAGQIGVESGSGIRIVDNILRTSAGAGYVEAGVQEGLTVSHNLYFGGGAAPVEDTNPILGDPRFVADDDFHLGEGSAARDAGVDEGVDLDLDGRHRPAGAGFDVGAFEAPVVP